MYPVSPAFHQAVAANEPQLAMFVFTDGVITNEDIDIEQGISFNDYFCTRNDIGIGEALSNELTFTLMNERQKFNTFPFGEFQALLGVRLSRASGDAELKLTYGGHIWRGTSIPGRMLTKDGNATEGQPSFAPAALAAINNKVYAFGVNGEIYAVMAGTGAQTTWPNNAFMTDKAKRFAGCTFAYENRILTANWADGFKETYEFCPLGWFDAKRPKVVDDIQINMTCNDRMMRFESDMASVSANIPYSNTMTVKGILQYIVTSEGVYIDPGSENFLNMDVIVPKEPEQFASCTKRDVIGWIAEVAGYNAKISRDGALKFVWVGSNPVQTFNEGKYTECRPYYYQTPRVNKLSVRNLSTGAEAVVAEGDGGSAYLIQDNPFM